MSFNELMLILKARRSIIAITFSIIVLLATFISLILPKTYEASTSLLLNYKGMDPVTGNILPSQLMPGYMATQIDVITSKNVAKKVVEKLKLTENPTIQAQFMKVNDQGDITTWLAERLLAGLNVRPSKQSSVIDIVYKGTDPKFVALVANTFAEAYEEVNVQLKVQPAKKAAIFFGVQTNALKKSLEKAQSNLSKYQQEHGITNVDGGLDVEQSKLNELSTQLVVAEGQLFESKSRNNSSLLTGDSPDVASSPLVQNLKVEVSRASAKLKELSEKYGQQHPLYIAAKSELDEQRSLLNTEVRNARGNVNETFNIYQQRVNDIKGALDAQKEKVLKLNSTRDELSGLQNEVLSAEKAMEIASLRFNATLQEASSNQSDLSVLNIAMPPFLPSNPKIKLNILIGIVLGLLLGITFAVIVESRDKRIRSKEDLNKLLDMQIFTISDLDGQQNTKNKLIASKPTHKLLKTA
jgi:succinoglycan biosynthesis transport protein ExoP